MGVMKSRDSHSRECKLFCNDITRQQSALLPLILGGPQHFQIEGRGVHATVVPLFTAETLQWHELACELKILAGLTGSVI